VVIKYARLLIEMEIDGPFSNYIEFFNDEDIHVRQEVRHEWVPTKCSHCAMFGHTDEVRKKKTKERKECRPV